MGSVWADPRLYYDIYKILLPGYIGMDMLFATIAYFAYQVFFNMVKIQFINVTGLFNLV